MERIIGLRSSMKKIINYLPGLASAAFIAWLGTVVLLWIWREVFGFEKSPVSGVMLAIVLGMILGNVTRLPPILASGLQFSRIRILQIGIVLLGLRLDLADAAYLGILVLPVIVICMISSMLIAYRFGQFLDIPMRLRILIAVGTSICGASAIAATAPTIGADEDEVAYSIGIITIFGLAAMFCYPYLANALFPKDVFSAGVVMGVSIHETAQVAGAGLLYGQIFGSEEALEVAMLTKLIRNCSMIVIIPVLAYLYWQRPQEEMPSRSYGRRLNMIPRFVVLFLVACLLRTIGDAIVEAGFVIEAVALVWDDLMGKASAVSAILITVAMAALGATVKISHLGRMGAAPLYSGLITALVVGLVGIGGVKVIQVVGLR